MSADAEATDEGGRLEELLPQPAIAHSSHTQPTSEQNGTPAEPPPAHEAGEDEEEDEEEEDEEPKLKYAKLTGSLTGTYRNGDSTSAFTIAGDKMVMGTHNGSVHVLSLPSLQGLRSYRGHQATVTSISVSPTPPPPATVRSEKGETSVLSHTGAGSPAASIRGNAQSTQSQTPRNPREKAQQQAQAQVVPNTPNNALYLATSSLDGNVCIQSLLDPKDVQLRNFARPVNAVVLSPDYKNDRTYLSAGLAGQLVLTVGGKSGTQVDANINNSSSASGSWLGTLSLGLAGSHTEGKDTVLHSGEGSISTIKWSHSGRWVVWVNEEGIKIMRSHLRLGSEDAEDAWRRVAHAAKPNRKAWKEMAGVWRGRCEWVNERTLEHDIGGAEEEGGGKGEVAVNGNGTAKSVGGVGGKKPKKVEKLVVGWGDTAWILHVQEGAGYTAHSGTRQVGSADIIHKLQFRDCIVSGISLYTPSLLAILAYRTRDDDDKPIDTPQTKSDGKSTGGRQRHRKTGLAPQLRLVNVKDGEEVDLDELSISRFETLSAQDYHLGTMYMPPPVTEQKFKESGGRGALQAVWEYSGGGYAERLFSSGGSVMSGSSSGKDEKGGAPGAPGRPGLTSPRSSVQGVSAARRSAVETAHPFMQTEGLKLVIQSPYDCVLAIKRGKEDHLEWLLEHERYAEAWGLLDEHPDILDSGAGAGGAVGVAAGQRQPQRSQTGGSTVSGTSTPSRSNTGGAVGQNNGSLADFFADSSDISQTTNGIDGAPFHNAPSQKEKRRIGDLWLQQLVSLDHWIEAGKVAGKVLGTSSRWEHWVWTFAHANKFDEITPYIPSTQLRPPLPSLVYEVVLGHYIQKDRKRLGELMEGWDPELFDVKSVVSAIEERLRSGEVSEESVEEGEKGRDWRILMEALAKLYLADGRSRDALRCYIRTQNADAAMGLIKEGGLVEAAGEDIPGLLMLRVSKRQMRTAPLSELEEASSEAVQLLVEEAHRGTVMPGAVIQQLERRGAGFQMFLFFYLRALWRGPQQPATGAGQEQQRKLPRRKFDLRIDEGHALVEDHADLAVRLFAEYDRELLMEFLKASEVYSYEKAAAICEQRHYIPELVYILGKTGQTKRALSLIIGELGDVKQAITFAKENGELWDDLLDYSMGKPRFIRGLLEEVGTAIDPVKMVRRIPEGLEIEGLKQGIQKMVREYEIQHSISEGVARVLRGEVGVGMDTLRAGRKKGVRFEVVHDAHEGDDVDLAVKDPPTKVPDGEVLPVAKRKVEAKSVKPGHCVGCGDAFSEEEKVPLIGFACGHVYHLPCLLRANPDTADERTILRLIRQLGSDESEDSYTGRSVGGKVAHAHIIKNMLKGGCQHCLIPEGA